MSSAQDLAATLRDAIGSAEEIERLTTIPVERVHLLAQGFAVASEEELLRLELLYRCWQRSPHSEGTLSEWLVRPRSDGPAPWLLLRAGRRKDFEALLV